MRTWITVVALASATSAWGQTQGPPPPRHPAVVVNPEWVSPPTPEEIAAVYPPGARKAGVSGVATIDCNVTVDGKAIDCRVDSETPAGQGFGAAALKLSGTFRLTPRMVDGRPSPGGFFIRQISFDPTSNPPSSAGP